MIVQIHDAIEALLSGDADFLADVRALELGAQGQAAVFQILHSLRDPAQVHPSKLPAVMLEKGDDEIESLSNTGDDGGFSVIGYTQQGMAADLFIGMQWHQADPERAYRQRLGLLPVFVDLFLRNPDPGGATNVYVRRMEFDRGALHPIQTALVTVRIEYAQPRISR